MKRIAVSYASFYNTISFIISFFLSITTSAQDRKFTYLTSDLGLTNMSITAIHQDKLGFLWIGTENGVNLYNGYEIINFKNDPADPNSISGNNIKRITEDKDSNLWISTNGGLNRYNHKLNHFENSISNPHDPLLKITDRLVIDSKNRFWFETYYQGIKLYIPENQKSKLYTADLRNTSSIAHNYVNLLYEDRSGRLWIATAHGLSLMNPDGSFTNFYSSFKGENEESKNFIHTVFEDHEKTIWVGAQNGVLHKVDFIKKELTPFLSNFNGIVDINENPEGLWLATNDGLYLLNPQTGNLINFAHNAEVDNSLSINMVVKIHFDSGNRMLVGTRFGGLNIYDQANSKFKHFKNNKFDPHSLSGEVISAFAEDDYGNFYVGSDGGGLSYYNEHTGKFTRFLHDRTNANSISNNKIIALRIDKRGGLWIGYWNGGLDYYNKKNGTFKHYKYDPGNPESISDNSIFYIFIDSKENVWVGTYSHGLNKYNKATDGFIRYTQAPHTSALRSKGFIGYIMEDHKGRLWISTGQGLAMLDPKTGTFTDCKLRDEIYITSIFEDSQRRLWFGSTRNGLNLFDRETQTYKTYTVKDGLPNETVNGILEDGEHNLWLSTYKGLSKFNPEKLTFKNFTVEDGLQSQQFSYWAFLKLSNGDMIFGGINGFNLFNPKNIKENLIKPPVYITDFKLFNKPVKIGENEILKQSIMHTHELELPYNQNFFSFEFVALNYTQPNKNKYKYIMEGLHKEWVDSEAERKVYFTNLSPGEYTFKVIASNNDSVWNKTGASIKLIITPPIWRTWYAYTLYGIAIIFGLYFFRKHSIIHIEERNKLMIEHLEHKKLAEITEAKMQFFTNISHEIRTPLTLISGPLETVLSEEGLTQHAKKNLSSVSRNVNRLLNLVNQLLQFRKLDLGFLHLNASETCIATLIQEVLVCFEQHAMLKNIDIVLDNQLTEEKALWLDKEMITTVFYNVLANAIKYTQPGGSVTIKVFEISFPKVKIWDKLKGIFSFYAEADSSIAVRVRDTGKGIAPRELKNIFRRFYQVNDPSSTSLGSGLGLSLVKEYVELHKGYIDVRSKPRQGTSFTIYFPRELKIENIKVEPLNAYAHKTEDSLKETAESILINVDDRTLPLVLITEDDAELLDYLRESLTKYFRIEVAINGKEGLEKVLDISPDLIISDIAMPEMDGYTFCKEIKSNMAFNHIPIILLTAKASEENMVLGYDHGADAYIPKPFNLNVLVSQAKSLIKSRETLRDKYRKLILLTPSDIEVESSDEKFLKQLMEITESNMHNATFDVPALVDEIGMSRSSLYRKVKALTDLSIADFIKTTRLKRAAIIFKKEKVTVTDVCYRVGFADLSYFSKCFIKEFGKTPSEYLNPHYALEY